MSWTRGAIPHTRPCQGIQLQSHLSLPRPHLRQSHHHLRCAVQQQQTQSLQGQTLILAPAPCMVIHELPLLRRMLIIVWCCKVLI